MRNQNHFDPEVSVLTAGRDRHYSLGLASALIGANVKFDFIGSDELESEELSQSARVNFLNLRGDQSIKAGLLQKASRVLIYYFRLLKHATQTRAKVFHILWNNKFELFDRTLLMGFYKLLEKKIALTAHNVNAGKRDGHDSLLNRASLRFQYRLCERIFVHTNKMKEELISDFGVPQSKIVLIPFGLNNAVPVTTLSREAAREKLGLVENHKVILFFGNIAPYKGLEFLVEAFEKLAKDDPSLQLVIAGRPKGPKQYWEKIQKQITSCTQKNNILKQIEYISDEQIEIYFKAADVLALPYIHIFQSGVLFLAYSFGLPVIATDVGSLKEEILEGKTGFVCPPQNVTALAETIRDYFRSDLHRQLELHRAEIRDFAKEKYSWSKVGAITASVYTELLQQTKHPNPFFKREKENEALSLNSHTGL
jgi:glycosyltransferase involved in cell wall biosynthesis